jgi:Predicted pyridoxal phosphate-dependent enzyme apparently involved in regulation of cell wall biogenesis
VSEQIEVPFGTMSVTDSARRLVAQAMQSGMLASGRLVREFEKQFADLIGTKEAVAVSSGTDADIVALAVLHDVGAERGDEVIVPALSFVATGNAVLHAGFTPAFVDVELSTLNIDPVRIEDAITDRTVAIMPVHLMGKPAPMDEIMEIAGRRHLTVIEDAAEAHATTYKGRSVGSIGDLGAFSLYVAHMISTVEGGIVTTDDESYAETLRSLRSHGRSCNCASCVLNQGGQTCTKRFVDGVDKRFVFNRIGYSCKMNELEAAVGLGNMEVWPQHLERRQRNMRYLMERFGEFQPLLVTIHEEAYEQIGPHAFPIIVGEGAPFTRDELVTHLAAERIDSRNLFLSMPTQCAGFAYLGYELGQFPAAEYAADNGLHIGVHQGLDERHAEHVLASLRRFVDAKA